MFHEGSLPPAVLLLWLTACFCSGASQLTTRGPLGSSHSSVTHRHTHKHAYSGICSFDFDPPGIKELAENKEQLVCFQINSTEDLSGWSLTVIPARHRVVEIRENKTVELVPGSVHSNRSRTDQFSNIYSICVGGFIVRGKRLGLTNLRLYLHPSDSSWRDDRSSLIHDAYDVIVVREEKLIDDVYRYGIIFFASLIYLGFGCQIDLEWMWSICKKPVAPAIAIVCQFGVMPLLGWGVAEMLRLDAAYAFGLLAMSCSPGGGGSNVYAHLLRGDLDLSICMTCINTLLSCAFMPFWMFTLGPFFIDPSRVVIPYGSIMRSLATIVLPLIIGLAIRRYLVTLADFLVKVTKPLSLILIVYMLTFGTYVNWYMFVIMVSVPEVIPAAILVPSFGFIFGYIIATVLRQGHKKSTTVSVETGYQNASIPIIMLQGHFQQPEGDLAAVMPVATAFFMQIPLYIWYAVLEIRHRCCKRVEAGDFSMVTEPEEGERAIDLTAVVEKQKTRQGSSRDATGNNHVTTHHKGGFAIILTSFKYLEVS